MEKLADERKKSQLIQKMINAENTWSFFIRRFFEEKKEYSVQKDVMQYLIWINIRAAMVHSILTDDHLSIIDEIVDGKSEKDFMEFCR